MDPNGLYDRIFKVVKGNNMNLIIVLDEIDMIKGKDLNDLMYSLIRMNDELPGGHVSIIGMSNDMKLKKRLDPRSLSTLCEEERVFPPYNAIQIKAILKQRISAGFQDEVVDTLTISKIAAYSAQDGDARYALRLLRKAGDLGESLGADKILPEHVENAKKAVEDDIMGEGMKNLPEHQQIVMYSIAALALQGGMQKRLSGLSEGDLFTGEVFEAYESNCRVLARNPRTIRQFSQYLNELEMQGFITTTMSGKGIRGNTRLIRLGYPPEEIKCTIKACLGIEQ
jgi:cell division control protein 6